MVIAWPFVGRPTPRKVDTAPWLAEAKAFRLHTDFC